MLRFSGSTLTVPRKDLSRAASRRHFGQSRVQLQFEPLESRRLLTVNWDGGGDGTSFTDPLNWDTNLVPGAADDAVINLVANPTIILPTGSVTVRSVASAEAFSITGGSLTVLANSTFTNTLSLSGGSLTAAGSTTSLIATGVTTISNTSLFASGGATLNLPNATSYSSNPGVLSTFQAAGAGSSLALGALTNVAPDSSHGGSLLNVNALSGGHVLLPTVTHISGPVQLQSNGANSQIDLSSLTSFLGRNVPAQNYSYIQVINSGTLLASGLTAPDQVHLTLDGNSNLATSQWTSFTNANMTISGGTPNFNNLATIANVSFFVSGGANVSLPAITAFPTSPGKDQVWQASGVGSSLTFMNLTMLAPETSNGGSRLAVSALSGGHVTLPAVTHITGPVHLQSNGAGSQIDLSAMTSFVGRNVPGQHFSYIQVVSGGMLLTGNLTTPDQVQLILDGSGTLATGQWTSFTNANMTISGGTPNFNNLATIANVSFFVSGGATVSLPAITAFPTSPGKDQVWQASEAGSSLTFTGLTNLAPETSNSGSRLAVNAFSGGHVTLPAVTHLTGPVQLYSHGAGSQIDLSAMTSFVGRNVPNQYSSSIQVVSGGVLLTGNLTVPDQVHLILDGSGTLATSQWTSFTNANMTISGGTPNFNNLATIANVSFFVSGGAAVSLPAITAFPTSPGKDQVWQASEAGSSLTFTGLTNLAPETSNSGSRLAVNAFSGGHVTLPAVTHLTGPVQLYSHGVGSQIDLSALTSFVGRNVPAQYFSSIQVVSGGVLLIGDNPNTLIQNAHLSATTSFTIQHNQAYASTTGTLTVSTDTLVTQGKLLSGKFSTIDVNGHLNLNGSGLIDSSITGTVLLSGDLLGNTTNNTQFNSQGFLTLDGSGTAGVPQQVEAMSADLGAVQSGFDSNFAFGTLSLANNTYVKLIDLANNAVGAGNEAIYVKKLNVPAGTTLDLNGLNLYVRAGTIAGTIINGTVTTLTQTAVVNRQMFYNNSTRYDVAGPAILPFPDDNAIATDKMSLRPGAGPATFANVSSYTRGLNGIIVDLAGTHGSISASDFIFRVGNNNAPSSWAAAPTPTTVTVRAGAGTGSDRIEIIWADGAIQKKWLEVIVRANANTGLTQGVGLPAGQADVFFFGHAFADSGQGDSATQAIVNTTDELGARNNSASLSTNIPITNLFDYNRDGQVNTSDALAARNNNTNAGNVVRYISVANPPTAPEASPASDTGSDDGGVAGALSVTSAGGALASAGVPRWLVSRLHNLDRNSGPITRYFEHLAHQNTPAARKILVAADKTPDRLGLEDALLDWLLADLGLG